jgi:biopolymer transport protein TolR
MLVLLVIFMVTAPLLAQGVKVDLPQASAKPLPPDKLTPLVVTVDVEGSYYTSVGENPKQSVDEATLVARVSAVIRHKPGTPVVVRGDTQVPYGRVVHAMVLLQKAGVPSVGLATELPENRN